MSPHVDLMNVLLVGKPRRSTRIKREHFMSQLATQHFMSDLLPEEATTNAVQHVEPDWFSTDPMSAGVTPG